MNIITGYDTILHKLSDIIKALKLNPGAREKLTSLYQQNRWLDIDESPDEDKLVRVALVRIEQDPSQFELFLKMLGVIKGMDVIVKKIRGGELSCSLCLYTYWKLCRKEILEIQPRPGALLYMKMWRCISLFFFLHPLEVKPASKVTLSVQG